MVGLQGSGNRRAHVPPPLAGSRRAPARGPSPGPAGGRPASDGWSPSSWRRRRSVVVDNPNPSPEDRAALVAAAREAGVPVRAVWVDAPVEVCLARNEARAGQARVPLVGVFATLGRLVPPSVAEGFGRADVVGRPPGGGG
ncbi:AAA family ATPase [Blastococcus saxobsidens]|uniref:AAA domain-containing protein n=1 Tax=Blastococcus saxobsidens TaxID=138336 RepID=A0A4Q7Y543_9ACTN|nr:AAA family ATPase [Blastococcus saxobsidens]RZU32012.1 AAA domain-containing protein [Blastococcus saxobsidens]